LQALLVTASLKGDGPTNYKHQATSNKQQATSIKHQASSIMRQSVQFKKNLKSL
jgi:hypothetical protein